MSNRLSFPIRALLCAGVVLALGFVLALAASRANAAAVSRPTVTVKRFTGLLSGSGPVAQSPGQSLSPRADWVDFICDPRTLNWKVRVDHSGRGPHTQYINGPRICDHVEIMMFYYNPQQSFPETGSVDGTAIYIKRIP